MNPLIIQNNIGDTSSKLIVESNNVGDLECGPHWPGMIPELLFEIAIRLPFMEDFRAFREVCTPWRAAATKDAFNIRFKGLSKIPFLVLAEKDGGSDDRQLYSLSRKTVWKTVSFPWFKNKRCMDAGFGWVLTVAVQGGEINLVKPFTGATIELPNFTTLPGYCRMPLDYMFITRATLSADPSRTSDFVVMLLTANSGIGYWSPGPGVTNLRAVDSPLPRCLFYNIGCYKGRMYDIDYSWRLRVRDPSASDFTKSESILQLNDIHYCKLWNLYYTRPYIVESSSGDLLLIFRHKVSEHEYHDTQLQTQFKVLRIDVIKRECESVDGIGKDAIFLGENAPVCVAAEDFPGVIKPNCIYFTDDCMDSYRWFPENFNSDDFAEDEDFDEDEEFNNFEEDGDGRGDRMDAYSLIPDEDEDCNKRIRDGDGRGGRNMGIYNFEDGSIERVVEEESLSAICPPFWIFPSF